MGRPNPLPLDWLRPTLDVCRAIVECGVHELHTKPSDGGREVVTDVDLQVERTLTAAILYRVPTAAILSEETSSSPQLVDEAETCFVLDPIDGTEEMVAGRPGFSISVAQYRRGSPQAAVVDFPRMDARLEGAVGAGVWVGGHPARLQRVARMEGARIAVSVGQHGDPRLRPVWDVMSMAELVPTPAFTPKFAAVLRGECTMAMHLPVDDRQTHIWDYAAVAMLLVEAGGAFVSWTGEDLLQARPFVHVGGWIAAADVRLARVVRDVVLPKIEQLPDQR